MIPAVHFHVSVDCIGNHQTLSLNLPIFITFKIQLKFHKRKFTKNEFGFPRFVFVFFVVSDLFQFLKNLKSTENA